MSDLQGRAKEIFLKALNQTGGRESFLENACDGDEALQQRVQALLKAHQEAGEFLPPSNLDATIDTGNVMPPSDVEGTIDSGGHRPVETTRTHTASEPQSSSQIGPYKLLEEIGEGGMGTVWVAQQSEPIKRKVAIKLIKAGMDSQQVLARFEAERQALAMMDHPNIARVVDAGMTEQGRPYFAMEYVKGVPLTEYCDHAKLSVKDRLELFLPICNAVQHAHQKGIIHRDLKPSNILICLYDGKPVPKVIDFGLAKAMHQSLTDRTLHTHHGMMIGTPLYMSPEQAESNNLDIDTRTDIYSLGVILYELLTGGTPLERAQLKEAVFLEILRLIKEVEPPKPSLRLSGSDSLPSVAAQRSIDPAQLSRSVTGDLDWVVMKALEKERGRRYETANGLAEDIRRHLSDEPVSASPPSSRYRMQKFVKRNKGPVLAASLLLVSLLAGIGGTTWGLLEANRQAKRAIEESNREKDIALLAETKQKNRAIEAEKQASAANVKAQQRAEQLEKSNNILANIFNDLDIDMSTYGEVPVEAVLAQRLVQAAEQLTGDSLGDPLVVAQQQHKLGRALLALGFHHEALDLFEKCVKTFTETLGPEHDTTLTGIWNLARAYKSIGLLDKAIPLVEKSLTIRRAKFGNEHRETLVAMNLLGGIYGSVGEVEKGIRLCEEALGPLRAKLGDNDVDTVSCMSGLATLYAQERKFEKALPLLERVLESVKAISGDGHPMTISTQTNLAKLYDQMGQSKKAMKLAEETLKLSRSELGDDHPDTLEALETTAVGYYRLGDLEESIPLFEELLKTREKKVGRRHESTFMTIMNLGTNYLKANRVDDALPLLEEAYRASKTYPKLRRTACSALTDCYLKKEQFDKAILVNRETLAHNREQYGDNHPETLQCLAGISSVAVLTWQNGHLEKSVPLFEELLELNEVMLGRHHRQTLHTMVNLAVNYRDAARFDEALRLLEEVYKHGMEDSKSSTWVRDELLEAYAKAGNSVEAIKLADETVSISRQKFKNNDIGLAAELAAVGHSLLLVHASAEAEPLLRECLAIVEKKMADSWLTFNTQSMLGGALLGQKKYEEAEPLLLKGYQGMKEREQSMPGPALIRLTDALERLVRLYQATDNEEQSAKWQAELDKRQLDKTPAEQEPGNQ